MKRAVGLLAYALVGLFTGFVFYAGWFAYLWGFHPLGVIIPLAGIGFLPCFILIVAGKALRSPRD